MKVLKVFLSAMFFLMFMQTSYAQESVFDKNKLFEKSFQGTINIMSIDTWLASGANEVDMEMPSIVDAIERYNAANAELVKNIKNKISDLKTQIAPHEAKLDSINKEINEDPEKSTDEDVANRLTAILDKYNPLYEKIEALEIQLDQIENYTLQAVVSFTKNKENVSMNIQLTLDGFAFGEEDVGKVAISNRELFLDSSLTTLVMDEIKHRNWLSNMEGNPINSDGKVLTSPLYEESDDLVRLNLQVSNNGILGTAFVKELNPETEIYEESFVLLLNLHVKE